MTDDLTPARFGTAFKAFMDAVAAAVPPSSPLLECIQAHLGPDLANLPMIAEEFATYDHPNVQVALDAYLARVGRQADLVGVGADNKRFMAFGLSDLLSRNTLSGAPPVTEGPVDYVNIHLAGERVLSCVQFGLYFISDDARRLIVFVAGPSDHGPHQQVRVEVLAGRPGEGQEFLIGRMPGRTTILTAGLGMGLLQPAAELARALAPSMVVLEDVDLIAEERGRPGGVGPLLFELLNEMDGLRDFAALEHAKTRRACQNILNLAPALWTFGARVGMEPTNNAAEWGLRRAVVWRRRSFGTQSAGGSRFAERLLTVVTTLRQQERDVLYYLTAALRGQPAPSLLPSSVCTEAGVALRPVA